MNSDSDYDSDISSQIWNHIYMSANEDKWFNNRILEPLDFSYNTLISQRIQYILPLQLTMTIRLCITFSQTCLYLFTLQKHIVCDVFLAIGLLLVVCSQIENQKWQWITSKLARQCHVHHCISVHCQNFDTLHALIATYCMHMIIKYIPQEEQQKVRCIIFLMSCSWMSFITKGILLSLMGVKHFIVDDTMNGDE